MWMFSGTDRCARVCCERTLGGFGWWHRGDGNWQKVGRKDDDGKGALRRYTRSSNAEVKRRHSGQPNQSRAARLSRFLSFEEGKEPGEKQKRPRSRPCGDGEGDVEKEREKKNRGWQK